MSNKHEAEPEVRRHGPGMATSALLTAAGAWMLFEAYRDFDRMAGGLVFTLSAFGVLMVMGGVHKFFEDARRALRDEKGKLIPTSRRPRNHSQESNPPRDENGFIDHDSEGLG